MNVIGIVQTDLNEFRILFETDERRHKDEDGDQAGVFEELLGKHDNGGDRDNLQEMTVRIKGVPEGQKATFLQMYQIIQDAREMGELERKLTIVSRGDENDQSNGDASDSDSR